MHDVKVTERKLLASRQTDYVTQEMQHLCRSGNCEDGTETPHQQDGDQDGEQLKDPGDIPQVLGAEGHHHDSPAM